MTVRELIEKLETLDQYRNIWVDYDCFYALVPELSEYTLDDFDRTTDNIVEVGDYKILSW